MAECSLVAAVNLALARAMIDDDRVLVLGEDVGINGGVFRATEGLHEKFGEHRVLDTPLAETAIVGVSIGLAAQGFLPVAEIQFMGFIYSTLDQIINHAARMRCRTRGRLSCPLVIRAPFGGGVHAPEHHSESTEALFTHVPGLRVVIPSSPRRAYGLLLAAIRDPDPVIFLEPKRLYRATKEGVDDNGEALLLDRCVALREGADVSVITWGAMTLDVLQAVDELAKSGIEADVIDVSTLKPLDTQTILDSVAKTGRAVIVHEAAQTGGFGGEISARIAEHGLFHLKAPIIRVAGPDTVMPLARLEEHYMPSVARVVEACRHVMTFS